MPTPLTLPYPPLVMIAAARPITWEGLLNTLGRRLKKGVSFLVLRDYGKHEVDDDRGGHFFHLIERDNEYHFSTFDRADVCKFKTGQRAAEFINHVTGLKYSEAMWHVSQRVNIRVDTA